MIGFQTISKLEPSVRRRLNIILVVLAIVMLSVILGPRPPIQDQITFDPATCLMTGADPVSVFRNLYQHIGYIRARPRSLSEMARML